MGRFAFIVKRLITLVPLLVGIVFVVFLLLKITPGNPATRGRRVARLTAGGCPGRARDGA